MTRDQVIAEAKRLSQLAEIYAEDGAPHTAADRLMSAATVLKTHAVDCGYPASIAAQGQSKSIDDDIDHLLTTLALDAEFNEDFSCSDGEMGLVARRLETTARRLVREAGYALPEKSKGEHDVDPSM